MNRIKIIILGIALLAAILPARANAEETSFGIKTPQIFLHLPYNYSANKFYLDEQPATTTSESTNKSKIGTGTYILEGTGSLVGGILGAVPGLSIAASTIKEDMTNAEGYTLLGSLASVLVLFPICSAQGTNIAGNIMHQKGSFKKTLKGGVIGGLFTWLIAGGVIMLTYPNQEGLDTALGYGAVLGIPFAAMGIVIGNVVGYNH